MIPELLATVLALGTLSSQASGSPMNNDERWWEGPLGQWGGYAASAAQDFEQGLTAPDSHIPRLIILIRLYGCRNYHDPPQDSESPDNSADEAEDATTDSVVTETSLTDVVRRDSHDGSSRTDVPLKNERTFRPPRYKPKADTDEGITQTRVPRY